jgi:hypothetical protein
MQIMRRMMKMNLRQGNGLVPIRTNDALSPYKLVEFPDRFTFETLFGASVTPVSVDKYWEILKRRLDGATLEEAGNPYNLSRERVRQIEAKFLRMFTRLHSLGTSSKSD